MAGLLHIVEGTPGGDKLKSGVLKSESGGKFEVQIYIAEGAFLEI